MERPKREYFVDMHCHCLPSMDDGPTTLQESLVLCEALLEDDITDVIATPHQLGRYSDANEPAAVREQVVLLNQELKSNGIPLRVFPGGDVRIDERICMLIEEDKVMTLADRGQYILLELPHEIFIDIEPLLMELSTMGIRTIVSHPERHPVIAKQPNLLLKWLDRSAHLQVTCGSLLGDFGIEAQMAAWHLLSMGWVSLVATDSHNMRGRRPRMKTAFESIGARLGRSLARLVCIDNPLRILRGGELCFARDVNAGKWMNEGVRGRY